jgi:cyanuric acid amidohydrolase
MQAFVHRLSMRHPGDVSSLQALLAQERLTVADIVAVIGKTEGNGGVNDFTRGYFTQSLMALLARHSSEPVEALLRRIPCVLSGGCEGVLSPHYLVIGRRRAAASSRGPALAVGVAMSEPVPPELVGRAAHIASVAQTVRRAMADAALDQPDHVHLVQLKVPALTVAALNAQRAAGSPPVSDDPNKAMALSRVAGALGVALALGETTLDAEALARSALHDFGCFSHRASVSSGVEVACNEVIVLGMSPAWQGPLRIAHRAMSDALDAPAVHEVLDELGLLKGRLQPAAEDAARVAGVLVKCEPDRRGQVRGQRHTMLDDTDINAQRHIRGAVGGLVAGLIGDGRVFVSGGAEHQGPDGGGLIAVIAEAAL